MTPFTTFNFLISFTLPGSNAKVCEAEFSECDGLEMNMEVKTIKEGGNNGEQIHLAGPITYGQLTLKRGMTSNYDLWDWFEQVQLNRNLRVDGDIHMLSSKVTSSADQQSANRNKDVVFKLIRCMPIKVRAPAFNATDGQVAIEEMQLVYERLMRVVSSGQGGTTGA